MRCVDVIRELATASGGLRSDELGEHLAQCAHCALWAERNGRVDRLWEASRPTSPSPAEWGSTWASISEALDRDPAPDVLPMGTAATARRRSFVVLALVQAAAAAAVLIAVLIPVRPIKSAPVVIRAEFDQGELPVIRVDDRGSVKTTDLALNESPARVDSAFEALNDWEGNALQ